VSFLVRGFTRHFLRAGVIGIVGVLLGFVANPEGLRLQRSPRLKGAEAEGPSLSPSARIDATTARAYFGRPDVIFLDARDGRDYERGHVAGALPLVARDGQSLVKAMRPWLHRQARIIIYAGPVPDVRASLRSGELRMAGFLSVQIVDGGFPAWVAAGGAVAESWDADELLLQTGADR
jgi:rhodanese-related sulfurtransferase